MTDGTAALLDEIARLKVKNQALRNRANSARASRDHWRARALEAWRKPGRDLSATRRAE